MLFEYPTRWSKVRSAGAATAIHLLAIAAILGSFAPRPVRVVRSAGTAAGARVDLVYMPGSTPASAPHSAAKLKPARAVKPVPSPASKLASLLPSASLPSLPEVRLQAAAPTANNSSLPSASPDQTQGSNSWGSGDAEQIALTTYSPSPAPDVSVLPRGVQGNVVVDVTISADGKVSDLTVLKTVGYGIESNVVATVRTWTFRPATKDGVPVASAQELVFHFGRPG